MLNKTYYSPLNDRQPPFPANVQRVADICKLFKIKYYLIVWSRGSRDFYTIYITQRSADDLNHLSTLFAHLASRDSLHVRLAIPMTLRELRLNFTKHYACHKYIGQ